MNPPYRRWILSLLALSVCFSLSLGLGAVSGLDLSLVMSLRLPRALLACWVGSGLAVAGAVLQALFSNPLCEPYTLGISSGAALGAVVGSSLAKWGGLTSVFGIFPWALAGSILFTLVLGGVARRLGETTQSLLLVGVMLSFLGTSGVTLWACFRDPNGVQSALGWLLGDLSHARMKGSLLGALFTFIMIAQLWKKSHLLDGLLLGEEAALGKGVPVRKLSQELVFKTALLVSLSVSAAGMIGFLGLVIPHLVRRRVGVLHQTLLPLCAIWGGSALLLADTLSRTLASPYELPVGAVCSFLGAPLFLVILIQNQRQEVFRK